MAKCGKCGQRGPEVTVINIRECYNGIPKAHGEPTPTVVDNPWPPSDPQVKYVLGLQVERTLPDDWHLKFDGDDPENEGRNPADDLRLMDRSEVSALIGTLKLFKRKDSGNVEKQPRWTMPPGRYAVLATVPQQDIRKVGQGGDTQWCFYRVDKPDKGKWKGYTFIKRLIGNPGDYREVDMRQADRDRVLARIEADPRKAAADFGKQTKHCGRCMSPLTHKRSRAAGYGEKCAGILGWPW